MFLERENSPKKILKQVFIKLFLNSIIKLGVGAHGHVHMNIEMPKKLYCTRSTGEFLKVASTNLHAARGAERVHQESTQLQVYTFLHIAWIVHDVESESVCTFTRMDFSLKGSPCEPETAYCHHMPG